MLKLPHYLLAIATLAAAIAAHAQTGPRRAERVGDWDIYQTRAECIALYAHAGLDIFVSLRAPRSGANSPASLFFTSTRYFRDAKEGQPYPLRLVVTTDAGVDAAWRAVVPTGLELGPDTHGILIIAPANVADSLAKAKALQLEGAGGVTIDLPAKDLSGAIAALRKCSTVQ